MRKVLFIALAALILAGCQSYREYSITMDYEIPDSSRADYRDMIESVTEAANPANLATNRSNDFGDIVYAAERVSYKTYSVQIEQLRISTVKNGNWVGADYVNEDDLSPELRIWFDQCKNTHTFVTEKID